MEIFGVIYVVSLVFSVVEDNICDMLDFVLKSVIGILDVCELYVGLFLQWVIYMLFLVVCFDILKDF